MKRYVKWLIPIVVIIVIILTVRCCYFTAVRQTTSLPIAQRVQCGNEHDTRQRIAAADGETVRLLFTFEYPSAAEQFLIDYPTLQKVECSKRILTCDVPKALAQKWLEEGLFASGILGFEAAAPVALYGAIATSDRFLGTYSLQRASRLNGRSEVVAVIDTGISTGVAETFHPELHPSLYGMTVEPSLETVASATTPADPVSSSHGTHVAGCIVGQGNTYSAIRGSALGAALFSQRIASTNGLHVLNDIADHFERSAAVGATIINCSWGHTVTASSASYGTYAYALDTFAWEYPEVLVCLAVGNSGEDNDGDDIVDASSVDSAEAYAKNALVVGAHENYRPSYTSTNSSFSNNTFNGKILPYDQIAAPYDGTHTGMLAVSSRGPLLDGRIAPMVVAPGSIIFSTLKDGTCGGLTGTSMATPLVSGAAAVWRQYMREVLGLTNPTSAAVRAGIVLSAISLTPGQFGTGDIREIPETSPNSVEGWGAVRLGEMLQGGAAENETIGVWDRIALAKAGATVTYQIENVQPNTNLSVVLSWIDAPALYWYSSAILRNDYDLTLISPSGQTYTLDDHLNPIERLTVAVGSDSGTWQVQVAAKQIKKTGTGNLAAIAWRAVTDKGVLALPTENRQSTTSVQVTLPEGVEPYIQYPVWPAPGIHQVPIDSPLYVHSGAWLPRTTSGTQSLLSGWIWRSGEILKQGTTDAWTFTPEETTHLKWYETFPGVHFLLR